MKISSTHNTDSPAHVNLYNQAQITLRTQAEGSVRARD